MIAINKSEKEAVVQRFPNIGVVRTMKQDSKRHHYYMEERKDAVAFINKLRGIEEVHPKKKYNNRGKSFR